MVEMCFGNVEEYSLKAVADTDWIRTTRIILCSI